MISILMIAETKTSANLYTALKSGIICPFNYVTNYDSGLKEIFEKKPALVFIQDEISSISSESVARHSQDMLKTSAPVFVLLYETESTASRASGLFKHSLALLDPTSVNKVFQLLQELFSTQIKQIFVESQQTDDAPIYERFDLGGPPAEKEACVIVNKNSEPNVSRIETCVIELQKLSEQPSVITDETHLKIETSQEICVVNKIDAISNLETNTTEPNTEIAKGSSKEFCDNFVTTAQKPITDSLKTTEFDTDIIHSEIENLDIHREAFVIQESTTQSQVLVKFKFYAAIAYALLFSVCIGIFVYLYSEINALKMELKKLQGEVIAASESVRKISKDKKEIKETDVLQTMLISTKKDSEYSKTHANWERHLGAEYEIRTFTEKTKLKAIQCIATKPEYNLDADLIALLNFYTGKAQYQIIKSVNEGKLIKQYAKSHTMNILIYKYTLTSQVTAFVIEL